jgi:diguanylate cyclase (GGDEF)-like protein
MDITERKNREEALVKIGITDELTGLYNRRYIMEQIEMQLAQQQQTQQPLIVSMLDIDDFKRINDTFGHLVGDEILRNLSSIIRSSIRYSDYCGRFGGEEFLIILPNSTEEIGKVIIDRINQRLQTASLMIIDKRVSFSAGIVEVSPNQGRLPDHFAVVDKADTLMYFAKTHGKNRMESGMF